MSRQPEISILIPTWNGASIIEECVEGAVRACDSISFEIIICDNGSSDETPRMLSLLQDRLPQLHWIRNDENLFFAKAVNQLAEIARGRHLFLLNNDVFMDPGALSPMLHVLESDGAIGAVAPQLRYPNGMIQHTCRRLPTFFRLAVDGLGLDRFVPQLGWKMREFDHRSRLLVEQPMMSALLIKGDCWRDVGPLDERFPLYFNDVDWSKRAMDRGWQTVFVPDAGGVHLEAWSGKRLGFQQVRRSMRGMHDYFLKHHVPLRFSFRYILLLAMCGGLCLTWFVRRLFER